ncbi:hypothetical protein KKB17_00240, partial [bacterium]|nr:hypothetical protein [bacterium]
LNSYMWIEMLWIPAFAGMTEETDGLDKSSPYNTLIISGRHKVCPYLYLNLIFFLLLSLFFHYPLYAVRSTLTIYYSLTTND